MKLIQLNIWQGRLLMNALQLIAREQPDILCLQELCSSPEGTTSFHDNLQDIQEEFAFPHVFFSPVHDYRLMGLRVGFGNAIMSRLPLTPVETVFTGLTYKPDFSFHTDDYNIRNFQHAEIAGVHVVNHHGHHVPGTKDGNAETLRQMDMIADYIEALNGPVILTGDFNLAPQSPSLARLNAGLTNLCVRGGVKTTRNFLTKNPVEIVDYIFVNDAVKVEKFQVYDDVISDHQALGLEFNV